MTLRAPSFIFSYTGAPTAFVLTPPLFPLQSAYTPLTPNSKLFPATPTDARAPTHAALLIAPPSNKDAVLAYQARCSAATRAARVLQRRHSLLRSRGRRRLIDRRWRAARTCAFHDSLLAQRPPMHPSRHIATMSVLSLFGYSRAKISKIHTCILLLVA